MVVRHFVAVAICLVLAAPAHAQTADIVRDIEFPVGGTVSYFDNFGDSRSGGRVHEGIDMLGPKMTPLLAAVSGRVRSVVDPEASWGYAITLEDSEGYEYHYLHVNNDTPGTDDGQGGTVHAYAPGIFRGAQVQRGQLVGWMGDSGNAENVGSHLHFEIRLPGGTAINPYKSLLAATRAGAYDPAAAMALATDINADRGIVAAPGGVCASGSRIKVPGSTAVYYCGADGKRYVFPNDKIYFSWFTDFTGVETVSPEMLASLPLGGNVTYRPGVRMVKVQTDPKVYAVDRKGTLRWVTSAETAAALYGAEWAKKVDDLSDAFFFNYTIGDPVTTAL